jgi:integrase
MLVETDIESGLRWGELTELRPRDLDFGTGVLTVSRVVVETSPQQDPQPRQEARQPGPEEVRVNSSGRDPALCGSLRRVSQSARRSTRRICDQVALDRVHDPVRADAQP